MGINSLWEIIGDGVKVNLSEFASDHFKRTGRPLRIAVDEPYWRYRSIGTGAVPAIRKACQRQSYPIEKSILFRILRCRVLGIQLVFVFDGPNRPAKRGKRPYQHDSSYTQVLRETLKHIGVPAWDAPGEAEAECAAMQQAGLVDAVWSGDSDSLMFGCSVLIRFIYDPPKGKNPSQGASKSNTHVQVTYTSDIIKRFPGLDRNGFVLLAVLAGGDYNTAGLHGCGRKIALTAIQSGFGNTLVDAFNKNKLEVWRKDLGKHFTDNGVASINIPNWFPKPQNVSDYVRPKVTRDLNLSTVPWESEINQQNLKILLIRTYNFSVQEYLKWMVPVLLVKALQSGFPTDEFEIEQVRKLHRKESGNAPETRVSFLLDRVTEKQLLLSWPAKDTTQTSRIKEYHHQQRVDCDVLDYLLGENLVGHTANQQKPTVVKKTNVEYSTENTVKPTHLSSSVNPLNDKDAMCTPKKRGRPRKLNDREIDDQRSLKRPKPSNLKFKTPLAERANYSCPLSDSTDYGLDDLPDLDTLLDSVTKATFSESVTANENDIRPRHFSGSKNPATMTQPVSEIIDLTED